MGLPRYIAGDWGTSNLRLFLCDADGAVVSGAEGPGVAQVGGDFAGKFQGLVGDWRAVHGPLPAVLCGMVGSDIGWRSVPYVACPALPNQIVAGVAALEHGQVSIVPGLRCVNPLGAPDFLRGEETQLLGALRLRPALGIGRHLVCLPGTHTKWVVLQDGAVREFLTAPTGELFAVLRGHSVLVGNDPLPADLPANAAFRRGLDRVHGLPRGRSTLLHVLFESRSRRLAGASQPGESSALLSGLLIGTDVQGALSIFASATMQPRSTEITLIGAPQITQAYATALSVWHIASVSLDGSRAVLAGMHAVWAGASRKESDPAP